MSSYDNLEENNHQNLIWYHIEKSDVEELQHDLYLGANPNQWKYMGVNPVFRMRPLAYAIEVGNIDCIKVLVENGANVKGGIHEEYGSTLNSLLENSLIHNETIDGVNIFEYFLANGADMISIHSSVEILENMDILDALLKYGADIDETYIDEEEGEINALGKAVLCSDYELAEKLLERGADVFYLDPFNNNTLLDYVLVDGNGDVKMCELLLKYGTSPNFAGYGNRCPMLTAKLFGYEECVKLFCQFSMKMINSNCDDS